MVQEFTARRRFLSGMAVGAAATLAASRGATATDNDGYASGYDAAPAGNFMNTVPRKPGDPVTFSVSLDRSAVKSTSGGWAREVNARHLPLATGIAGAHLFMNPGGSREMHWHATAAEWAFVLTGQCQVIVVAPTASSMSPTRAWRSVVLSEGPCARHLDAGRRALSCAAHLR